MKEGIIVSYKLENMDINKNKTTQNVRDFFDNEFQTYLNRSGLHRYDLSSPQIDPTGVTAHGGNSQETKMMQIFDYQAKCAAIYKAIEDCTENKKWHKWHRSILHNRYIDELEDWQIAQRLGISSSRYRAIKSNALCEFADRLPVWAYRCGTRLPDLRVYSSKKKEVSK